MNIIKQLKADHKKVKGIFTDVCKTTSRAVKTRRELFQILKNELSMHENVEENIFYPRLKSESKTKQIILESYEEHHVMDLLINELGEVEPSDETWIAKVIVLKEVVEHHVKEEENTLFPKVEKILTSGELNEMGEEMMVMKEQKN